MGPNRLRNVFSRHWTNRASAPHWGQTMLLPSYPLFPPLDGGLDGLGPDPQHLIPYLKLGAAKQLIVRLARHKASNPPQVLLCRPLHNLKVPLGFRQLLGR